MSKPPGDLNAKSNVTSTLDSANATPSKTQVIKRTLYVNISDSLSHLAMAGPLAGLWKPGKGKESELFYPSLEGEVDPAEIMNSIRMGVVRSVNIKEHMSTFPVSLGVSISCIPASEVTEHGQKYTYTVLPKSRISSAQNVYTHNTSMQQKTEWHQEYAEWNANNLETHKVMDTNGAPYVFVSHTHPVIGLLRYNSDLIGCDIDKQPRLEGEWVKLTRQVLKHCCDNLRTTVLSKIQHQDLNAFAVQLHRLNSEAWDDINDVESLSEFNTKADWSDEETEKQKQHHLRQFATKPYQYAARLEVEYEIPCVALQ